MLKFRMQMKLNALLLFVRGQTMKRPDNKEK